MQKLPDSVVKSVSWASHWQNRCVRRNGQFEVSRWFFYMQHT